MRFPLVITGATLNSNLLVDRLLLVILSIPLPTLLVAILLSILAILLSILLLLPEQLAQQ